jgi:RNA polymerase sigma factor (sigma-70 family)
MESSAENGAGPAEMSDAEIVARCRRGDQRAWDQLVERFSRYVFAIATQAFRLAEHDAEEVFQEVFTRTYTHLHTLREDEAIRPWIAQTTRRVAIDRIRSTRIEQPPDALPESGELDAELERIDLALDVHRAMAGLPESCQEILDRFFAQDQSYHVIAESLGIPAGTIASRISRCLSKLRTVFEETAA